MPCKSCSTPYTCSAKPMCLPASYREPAKKQSAWATTHPAIKVGVFWVICVAVFAAVAFARS